MIFLLKPLQTAFLLLPLLLSSTAFANPYQHSIKAESMMFSWSIDQDNLNARISAPTEGWVAVGFNPTNKMQHANIILGSVDQGKVAISDEFGKSPYSHAADDKLGGSSDVKIIGGSEENGVTTIEFAIPLNPADLKTDSVIQPTADTVVILAYGKQDSFRIGHGKKRYRLTINLSTGEVK